MWSAAWAFLTLLIFEAILQKEPHISMKCSLQTIELDDLWWVFYSKQFKVHMGKQDKWGRELSFGISQQGNFKTLTLWPQKGRPLLLRITHVGSDSGEAPRHLHPCFFLVVPSSSHLTSQHGSGPVLWLLAKSSSFISRQCSLLGIIKHLVMNPFTKSIQ